MMVVFILIVSLVTYYGLLNELFYASVIYVLIRKIMTRKWADVFKYSIFISILIGFRAIGINTLWVLLGYAIYSIVKSKNGLLILRHPILSYEYMFRQAVVLWSKLVIKSTPGEMSFGFVHDMNVYSKKRIMIIEARGVKFEFLQELIKTM